MLPKITVETLINAPIEKVWEYWTEPEHIKKWAFADDSWHAPHAENDIRTGGKFLTRMEAKDGSSGFGFAGTYTNVVPLKRIDYEFDGRKVETEFIQQSDGVRIVQTFEGELENTIEVQKAGWQGVLENFKKHISES